MPTLLSSRRSLWVLFLGLLLSSRCAAQGEPSFDVAAEALRQVARHSGVFHAPPVLMPTRKLPDGPLLGNGDLGVAIGTVTERLRYHGLGSDRNNSLSLGLVRMLFQGMLDVSTELGTDADRRDRWWDILNRLSDFPTVEVDGIRRIRGAEAGPAASRIGPSRNNTRLEWMGMVWPTGVLGLGSDQAMLRLLQDDARGWAESEWIGHFNGFSITFPGAARVGYDPEDLLLKLRRQVTEFGLPNLMIFGGGGGIENCSGVPATINEMLLQSHDGVLRLFPVWPRDRAARFGNLRARGAFLMSSQLREGRVQSVQIRSERGRECVIQNPWPGQPWGVLRKGQSLEPLPADRASLATRPGEILELKPLRP